MSTSLTFNTSTYILSPPLESLVPNHFLLHVSVAGDQAVDEPLHDDGLPPGQDEQEPQLPLSMILHSMNLEKKLKKTKIIALANLWLHPEVKCPEEEEGEGSRGVGQGGVVPAGGHQQPRQQAADHAYVLIHGECQEVPLGQGGGDGHDGGAQVDDQDLQDQS